MNLIVRLIITAAVAFGLSYILPGVHINSFATALILAVVLGILNAVVKPILVILTFPITILTLGLFMLVINFLIIYFAERVVEGFSVDGFWWAIIFSFLLSLVTSILSGGEKD
ncbi:phage holin family protein [Solitalea sp. MAHUQ-68]|uniref:Phage holin family protein n=1 Tax=Solitalea agri TaxID=2953739 RepID=A0A9X2JE15_9SPHI|nr:phage holin family protein [Solitalea agri]MCO4294713.1 phage holin family protein [Solitalea agri]